MARKKTTGSPPGKRRTINFDADLFKQIEEFGEATERGIDASVRWLIRKAISELKKQGDWQTSPGFRPDAAAPPSPNLSTPESNQ